MLMEDLDADDNAPEVARQQGNVEKGGRGQAEHDGGARVEEEQAERVARQVTPNLAVAPHRLLVARAVEDGRHDAVDDGAPEAELADDLVERTLADEELLGDVTEAVKSGADEGEEVALELVAARDTAEAAALGQVVGAEEDADAADADEDAGDLRRVVTDVEEDEGDEDDHDDGPEVDELSGEDGAVGSLALRIFGDEASCRDLRVPICKHGEVVPLDIQKCQDDIFPTIFKHELDPALEAIFIDCVGAIDQCKEDIIPQSLESRDREGSCRKERREGIGGCEAKS